MNRSTLPTTTVALPVLVLTARRPVGAVELPAFSYPIGCPDALPGDGFRIRRGYACENTWYNPGYSRTGED